METSFESLAQFATADSIIRLVAKERSKFAAKSNGTAEPGRKNALYWEVKAMTPPHRMWNNPGRWKLPRKGDVGIKKWTYRKRAAAVRINTAICRNWNDTDAEWNINLRAFVEKVQADISNNGPLKLETPTILPKFKKRADTGEYIFRPICLYRDLETKVILALTYQYLLKQFDACFHDDMLFMRSARRMKDGSFAMPKYTDAIDSVARYRERCGKQDIYVGECDIQKFYDIFNHDDILECFDDLFREKTSKGVPEEVFHPVKRVITAYLDSFDYPGNVMGKNRDAVFWRKEKDQRRTKDGPEPVCRFEWVKPEDFIRAGCYTEGDLRCALESGKIGIPQGGALSGIIVNVVMRVIDKPIVSREDPQRLFIRYCDDILLMHTDRALCEDYLEKYARELVRHRLLPHPFKQVADLKSGQRTKPGFWKAKSKLAYKWGSGSGDASDWIAFVGYEMRRTGEIRIRKDKIDQEFKRIAHQYYRIIKSKKLSSGKPLDAEGREGLLQRFDSLSNHILDFEKTSDNRYTRSQARRLDKYLYKKTRQAANKIGVADSVRAARERKRYAATLKTGKA